MNRFFYAKLAFTNMKKNCRSTVPYLLSCILAAAMNYIIQFLVLHPGLSRLRGGDTLRGLLLLGTVVAAVFFCIFLLYTNSFLIRSRKMEFGLFNILGMEKKHISVLMLCEMLYTAAAAFGIGLPVGILFSKLMLLVLGKLVSFDVPFGFHISGAAVGETIALFGGIFLICLLANFRQLHFAKPVELLHGGQVGEREPRSNWALALTGMLSLGAGYFIAVSTREPAAAMVLFFAAVLLVILGTYCLFTAGSTVVLKLLRKRKRYYYQTSHFISISGMLYRMKRNAVGLATICILSAAVLLMISGSVSLYAGIEDIVRSRYPRDIFVNMYDDPEYACLEEVQEKTAQVLDARGISAAKPVYYRCLSAAGIQNGHVFTAEFDEERMPSISSVVSLYFYSLEDYNRMTGRETILGEQEVLVYSNREAYAKEQISLFGKDYAVKERLTELPFDESLALISMGGYYIVLPDMEAMQELDELQKAAYGSSQSKITTQFGFDLDVPEEEEGAIAQEIAGRLEGLPAAYRVGNAAAQKAELLALNGGFLFLGMFLGLLFVLATILIIYYKQLSEGYEDRARFAIMQKVGLAKEEIRASVRFQVLSVFFLPLAAAAVHICFSFPLVCKLLALLGLANTVLFGWCTAATIAVFAVVYFIVYTATARVYYRIQVEQ